MELQELLRWQTENIFMNDIEIPEFPVSPLTFQEEQALVDTLQNYCLKLGSAWKERTNTNAVVELGLNPFFEDFDNFINKSTDEQFLVLRRNLMKLMEYLPHELKTKCLEDIESSTLGYFAWVTNWCCNKVGGTPLSPEELYVEYIMAVVCFKKYLNLYK